MNQRVFSNATGLVAAVMERGLTATQAARSANMSRDAFDRAIKADVPLTLKTAARLKAAFGADVVKFNQPRAGF